MSLPREWNFQDSRGSLYCPSEPDPIGRVEYQSGRFIRSSNGDPIESITNSNATIPPPPTQKTSSGYDECGLPIAACSQPAASSLLTECQQSTGSLFSVVSAPPVPLAELDVKQVGNLNGALAMGGICGLAKGASTNTMLNSSTLCADNSIAVSVADGETILSSIPPTPRRPISLPIETKYYPPPPTTNARTLHSSLLQHQISEIEEDDNENLLTVSSITAKPLIAKSRELCTNRQSSEKLGAITKHAKLPENGKSRAKSGGGGLARHTRDSSAKYAASSSRSSVSAEPPDGGYGWLIVFGAFSVQFWVAGLVKSYGVLYVEIMETFPSSTATVASWIPAILSALCLALAPLSSALCQRFSCRSVVFVGGLFCALGLMLSYFATSLVHLLFTFGILTGIGGGLSTTPGIVIVSQYFDKHRALANGICVSGTAAGSFILPVLIKHLAEAFGFHGTILVLGGCMLHVCFSATLYKPLDEWYNNNVTKMHEDEEEADSAKPLNDINPSTTGILTASTYLDTCDEGLSSKYIEHLFMEESKNRLNDYYSSNRAEGNPEPAHSSNQDIDDEDKDIVGETTFIKPMKKVRSSGIMHSVEDLSTDSTWVYRTDSMRGSRRRRNVFANDEIISKIQAHLEKPLSPPAVVSPRGLSKSMDIPTPMSAMNEVRDHEAAVAPVALVDTTKNVAGKNDCDRVEDVDEDDDDVGVERRRTCCDRIRLYLDITLLSDPIFILMCLSVTLMSVGCPYMLYYLPAHVISIGYNKSEAGYLVAISAVLDLCGRLGLGYLSDLQLFDRRKTYIVCIFGAGCAVLTIPFEAKLYLLGCSAALYGLCLGSWYVLMPVLLADIFGTDRISSSYGLVRMFQSIGAISVPPLAGYLRDLSGSYQICFYCMGSCMLLGCMPLFIWLLVEYKNNHLTDTHEDSDENFTVP